MVHDAAASKPNYQVFWLSLLGSGDTASNAELRAWLAINHDVVSDYNSLTPHKRGQWTAAYRQALQLEAVKLAYRTEQLIWLVKQDVDIDVHPFTNGWKPATDLADIKVIIVGNDSMAALAKLTWGGNH